MTFSRCRAEIGTISRQAVYDALATLTERGVLRRIQPAGSSARYEDRVGDNHHHLICRACNRMVDVDCAVGEMPCLTPSDDAGFAIDEAEVTFWGLCPSCAGDPHGSPTVDHRHTATSVPTKALASTPTPTAPERPTNHRRRTP